MSEIIQGVIDKVKFPAKMIELLIKNKSITEELTNLGIAQTNIFQFDEYIKTNKEDLLKLLRLKAREERAEIKNFISSNSTTEITKSDAPPMPLKQKPTQRIEPQILIDSYDKDLIENRFKYIECFLQKLDLKLRLVEEEVIEKIELDSITKNIENCNPSLGNDFSNEINKKVSDNRLKKVLKWFSLICPMLGAINQTILSNISSKDINVEIIGNTISTSKAYFGILLNTLQVYIDTGSDAIDTVETLIDLDVVSSDSGGIIGDAYIKTSKISSTITSNIFNNVKNLSLSLTLPNKYTVSSTVKKSYEILSKTFCLLMFNFILFTNIIDNTHYVLDVIMFEDNAQKGGGKKTKRTKDPVKALLEFNNKTLRDIINPTNAAKAAKTKTKPARKSKATTIKTVAKKKK